jgi:hypothetical protein
MTPERGAVVGPRTAEAYALARGVTMRPLFQGVRGDYRHRVDG